MVPNEQRNVCVAAYAYSVIRYVTFIISWQYILNLQREDNLFKKDKMSGPKKSFIHVCTTCTYCICKLHCILVRALKIGFHCI